MHKSIIPNNSTADKCKSALKSKCQDLGSNFSPKKVKSNFKLRYEFYFDILHPFIKFEKTQISAFLEKILDRYDSELI